MNNFTKLMRLAERVIRTLPDPKIEPIFKGQYIRELNAFAATAPYHLHSDSPYDQHFFEAYNGPYDDLYGGPSSYCRFTRLMTVESFDITDPFVVGIAFGHAFGQMSEYGYEAEDGWANIRAAITMNGIEISVEVDNVWVDPPDDLEDDEPYSPTKDEIDSAKDDAAESIRQTWDGWFNEETE